MVRFSLPSALAASLCCVLFYGHTALAAPQTIDELLARGDYDAAAEAARYSPHPLGKLIDYSIRRQLASHPMWMALIHYRKGLSGKLASQVDAEHFFLSRAGKRNPEKELMATLAALYAEKPKKPLRLTPYCRFVARRHWIVQELGELGSLLPQRRCEEFERYRKFLDAEVLTIIFPAAQPNSPSSAFGHTLLRIDRRDQKPETRMLNMSLNFAAEVPVDVNSFSYVVGGLAGGFRGRFRMLPYYMKLREYRQIDNRDIWEYSLRLDKQQIDIILRHAYEMLIAYYDYYFFSENCSYHLLSLLDVAFPEQPLIDEFPIWTIPIDTIRVLEERGLIREARYVPSMTRIIRQRQQLLTADQVSLAASGYRDGLDSIRQPLSEQPEKTQAQILDLLSDYQRYGRLNSAGEFSASLDDTEKETLRLRSRIAVNTEEPEVAMPGVSPEKGHGTARVAIGMETVDDATAALLQFRPAYHDLLDPSDGYGSHSAIDFFNLAAGWDEAGKELFLRSFTLLDIQSLEARDSFFKPVSWRTRIGWEKYRAELPTKFTALGGAGLAWRPASAAPLGYLFLEGSVIDYRALEKRTRLAMGARAGMLWEPLRHWRLLAEIDYQQDLANNTGIWRGSLQGSYALRRQVALVVKLSGTNLPNNSAIAPARHIGAMIRLYF